VISLYAVGKFVIDLICGTLILGCVFVGYFTFHRVNKADLMGPYPRLRRILNGTSRQYWLARIAGYAVGIGLAFAVALLRAILFA